MHEFEEEAIAAPTDRPSAELLVSMLKTEGIPARIASTGIEPSWTMGSPTRVTPLRVLVASKDAARAREFLAEAERRPDLRQ